MRTLIGIPCMDMVHTGFFASVMAMRRPEGTEICIVTSSLVYDARNYIAQKAVNQLFDRVLWLDSDMKFGPDLMERLGADLDAGSEFTAGLYFTRKAPIEPVFYSETGFDAHGKPFVTPMREYPRDTVFEAEAVGFGACMTSVPLIRRVGEATGRRPFSPEQGFGEDVSFCRAARALGAPIRVDGRVKVEHIGYTPIGEDTYLRGGAT